ncbi:hypothetical protein RHSIM_Rhsim01G0164100 [Rhododendron simsii]|uniref:Uncharacterized protein n=1 Tax=Rhododendron simsii TaxID=118357 RepID=A0A834HEU0_RHOSS|nr:hypothetical protein RHSIM_Rhsim01G0164100 [Rhododendron simsii]
MKTFFELLEFPLSEIAIDHTTAFTSCVNYLISKKVFPLFEQIKLEEFGSIINESLTIAAYCQKEMKDKQDTLSQFAAISTKLDTMGSNIHQLKDELQQIEDEKAKLLARLSQLDEQQKTLLARKELISHELSKITCDEQGTKAIITMANTDFLKYQERYNATNSKWSYFSKLFIEANQIETMEIDLNNSSSSFDAVNQPLSPITAISGWDDPLPSNPPASWSVTPPTERVIVRMEDPPLYSTQVFDAPMSKSATNSPGLWMKTNTVAHYDPFWVDYEVHHEKVVKLHNKVLDLNHSNWDLPPNPSKTLLKKHENWLRKKNYKRANLLAKAEKSVMAMRPLVDKKIKMDAEEMARDKEHEFLTYVWEKFHVFVTWSFSHYFEIIRIDADGNPIAPVNA